MPPRHAPPELSPADFRRLGHQLVDDLASFLEGLPSRKVSPGLTPAEARELVAARALPAEGADAGALLAEATRLMTGYSLFNGHPRFMGYITSSAAPLGSLADLLAATVNPNCGSWGLSPMATLIEAQTVAWIAELVGCPRETGGILVSGGNMANMVGFWAARAAASDWDLRGEGVAAAGARRLVAYCSAETHTWIQKAADLSGLGTDAVRWIPVDAARRMDVAALAARIRDDRQKGLRPFMVVGTAGSVSTGAVDPLKEIATLCRAEGLWFHVDGAYGAPAVLAPSAPRDLEAMADADSVAVDPHKWLYAPLEAGCALVRDPSKLRGAFSYTPAYYHFDSGDATPPPNYYEHGPQNSRGFRALKVWLTLQQVGRGGYAETIEEDMRLSRRLFDIASLEPELEAVTQGLSITTFRYVPPGVDRRDGASAERLNDLNSRLLDELVRSGRAYVSNAMVDGRFLLRSCIVNFRTTEDDLRELVSAVVEIGRAQSRPAGTW
jgi:glutamate/tyrosine decarboxylase-like PLP-dependent enzyme